MQLLYVSLKVQRGSSRLLSRQEEPGGSATEREAKPAPKGKKKKKKWIQNETSGNDFMILSSFREEGYVKLNSTWQAVLS